MQMATPIAMSATLEYTNKALPLDPGSPVYCKRGYHHMAQSAVSHIDELPVAMLHMLLCLRVSDQRLSTCISAEFRDDTTVY